MEALIKVQKEYSFVCLLRSGLGKAILELWQGLEGGKVLIPGNLAFPPEVTGVISPKAAMNSVCNACESPCFLFVPHGLISVLLTLSYYMIDYANSI